MADPRLQILRDGMFTGWASNDPTVEARREQTATAKLAEIDLADPVRIALQSEATRRRIRDRLRELWEPHEGQPMFQADKLARQAVNVVLAALAEEVPNG